MSCASVGSERIRAEACRLLRSDGQQCCYDTAEASLVYYTVSKKPDPWDILKYFQQIWTDINKFWYSESPMNLHSYGIRLVCDV